MNVEVLDLYQAKVREAYGICLNFQALLRLQEDVTGLGQSCWIGTQTGHLVRIFRRERDVFSH